MGTRRLFVMAALALGVAASACRAEVEDPGEMPEVNVEGGQAPKIDVDPVEIDSVDIDVGTDTQTVETPEVDVNTGGGNNNP
jgi:hypothetical protein